MAGFMSVPRLPAREGRGVYVYVCLFVESRESCPLQFQGSVLGPMIIHAKLFVGFEVDFRSQREWAGMEKAAGLGYSLKQELRECLQQSALGFMSREGRDEAGGGGRELRVTTVKIM